MTDAAPFIPFLTPPDSPAVSATLWFAVRHANVAITDEALADPVDAVFLGMWGTIACWAVDDDGREGSDDGAFVDLRRLWGTVSETEWTIAGRLAERSDGWSEGRHPRHRRLEP